MAEGAQGGSLVAGVEQGGCDATQIARPHEVIDVVAVVIALAPRSRWGGHERAGVRFVLEAAQHSKGRAREHPFVPADLAEGLRQVRKATPGALERGANAGRTLLQDVTR